MTSWTRVKLTFCACNWDRKNKVESHESSKFAFFWVFWLSVIIKSWWIIWNTRCNLKKTILLHNILYKFIAGTIPVLLLDLILTFCGHISNQCPRLVLRTLAVPALNNSNQDTCIYIFNLWRCRNGQMLQHQKKRIDNRWHFDVLSRFDWIDAWILVSYQQEVQHHHQPV